VPLVMAPLVERAERKKPFYLASTAGRFLFLGGLVASVLLLSGRQPWLLGAVVVAMLFAYRAGIAVGLLSFYEFVAHSVPARRRGGFFAWRRTFGCVLAIGGAVVVGYLLDEARSGLSYPHNYAAIFACAMVLSGGGALAFCFVREPRMHVDRRDMGLVAKLREGWQVSRRDHTFRRLILCHVTSAMRAVASPFYVIYCLAVLGAEPKAAAVFLIAQKVTLLVTNPLWARVSDGKGNATLLRAAYALGVGAPLLALVLPWLPREAVGLAGWGVSPRWIGAVALYVLYWTANCGVMLGGVNYMMEIAPPAHRPSYMAMGRVYSGPVILCAPLLGGWLAKATGGYGLSFVLAACFAVVPAVVALGLVEPREGRQAPSDRVESTEGL